MGEFKILVTKQVLEFISTSEESLRPILDRFLDYLWKGDWKDEILAAQTSKVQLWIDENSKRNLFTSKINNKLHFMWEPVLTVNMSEYYKLKPSQTHWRSEHFLSDHLVIYSISESSEGSFPLQIRLEEAVFIRTQNISPDTFKYLPNQIYYNEELFHLTKQSLRNIYSSEQKGLPINLTPEQAEILGYSSSLQGPVLLSGEAGSGKTTVITHWLLIKYLNEETREDKQLFVTYSPRLVNYTKEMLYRMLPPERRPENIYFLTYRQLLMDKIADWGGLTRYKPEKEMTFERFLREYSQKHVPPNMDPVLIWDEIRSVIKGNSDLSKKIMDLHTYESLREEKGHCKTPKNMRSQYHEEALRYQNYLDREGMWDSIDLAYSCILRMKDEPYIFSYDWIACDETQDLAPIEIELLIRLVKNQNIDNIFFTGDIAQVINPSGFTWAKLKSLIFQHQPKSGYIQDAWYLKRNFRSTNEIVELVNCILDTRNKLLRGKSERAHQISYRNSGIKPMVLKEDPIKILGDLTSNPNERMILVKNKEQKSKIELILASMWDQKSIVRQATVLTVEEAKGLEWEGVLLWNFFIPRHEEISKNEWTNVFIPQKRESWDEQILRGEKLQYSLTYEFNLLHVGLTRARQFLFIYDQDEQIRLTNMDANIHHFIDQIELEYFQTRWETKSPKADELEELARKLLEKDYIQAQLLFKDAANIFLQRGNYSEAAKCYEEAELFEKAAECYANIGELKAEKKALAKHYESINELLKAGNAWFEVARFAADSSDGNYYNFTEANQSFDRAIGVFDQIGQYEDAARASEEKAGIGKSLSVKLVEKLEAINYWQKAEMLNEVQRVLEEIIAESVNVADDYIIDEPRASFLGKRYRDYALILSEIGSDDTNYVISLMMDAAKFFKQASREKELPQRKRIEFIKNQSKCISQATDWYINVNEIDKAIKYRREFLDSIRKDEDESLFGSIEIDEWWLRTINIIQQRKEYLLLKREIEDYNTYLKDHNKFEEALTLLEEKVQWYKSENQNKLVIKLIVELANFYEREREFKKAASYWCEIGGLQSQDEEREIVFDSMVSYRKAGANYIRIREYEEANECFRQGKNVGDREMSGPNVGWYCLREVALSYWVPEVHASNVPITKVKKYIEEWIELAVVYFQENTRRSIIRLNGYIDKLKISATIEGPLIDSIRKFWTHYCLSILYKNYLVDHKNEEYFAEMQREFITISEEINFIIDRDISNTDRSSEVNELWKTYWRNLQEYFRQKKEEALLLIESNENRRNNV